LPTICACGHAKAVSMMEIENNVKIRLSFIAVFSKLNKNK